MRMILFHPIQQYIDMAKHYVDNKKLFTVLVQYKGDVEERKTNGLSPPPIPEYVGLCILQIANKLSTKANFVNYMFREEMISDGIENCINYMHNFDPEKSQNPFAYFTQIIYYAFLRRIQKEKKQLYIKQKSLENLVLEGSVNESQPDDVFSYPINVTLDNDYMNDLVASFEAKKAKDNE